jgi:hypothetical protein
MLLLIHFPKLGFVDTLVGQLVGLVFLQ